MPVKVVVGMQWGDEGKGKMVDTLSEAADLTVRYQGGDNAGHTVINEHGVFKLHLIPCGIFRPNCTVLIGTGTVVNPAVLLEEIEMLREAGVGTENLRLSDRAQLILPHHVLLDEAMEKKGGIGTTKRGIGPAYADKYLRTNLRAGDLLNPGKVKALLEKEIPAVNARLFALGAEPVSAEELLDRCEEWRCALEPVICDGFRLIHDTLEAGSAILFEGQLGAMKDIDLGIYPYVTSSHPVAAYAAVTGGFPASKISDVCGVFKAFSSAVGDGPFPTEMSDEDAAAFRGSGENPDDEFGARTGRPRRLGWLDLPVLRYAHRINGFTELAMTKLDKLDGAEKIRVCTGYMLDGKRLDFMPDTDALYRVEPIYRDFSGWQHDTAECENYEDLPARAREYVEFLEGELRVPIKYIGNGPHRDQLIHR